MAEATGEVLKKAYFTQDFMEGAAKTFADERT